MKQFFTFLKNYQWIGVVIFFCLAIFIIFYPITKGLIALPLDLLVASYKPWYSPGTILLKNPYMQDTVTQMFPWKHYLFTSLQEGVIPFWNPYQFGGAPFMGNLKSMVFYPLHIVYFLGEIRGWHLFLMLQLFLSLSFSYLFVKEITKSTRAGVFSSLAFTFNSLMIGVLYFGSEGHVLLWLPLMLFASKKYIDSRNVFFIAIFSSALTMSILAGQLQYVAYECLMIGAFSLWYARSRKSFSLIRDIAPIGMGMFLGALASAIQLVPSISVFLHSYRGATDPHIVFSRGLLEWWQVFRLVSQDLFGNPVTKDLLVGYIETSGYFGLIPLFFSVFAMVFYWKKNIFVRIFTTLFVVGIVLSLKGFGEIISLFRIPVLSSAEGGRMFVLTLFSGSFLAGIGFSQWLSGEQKEWKKFMFIFVVFLLSSYAIGFSQYHLVGSISQFIKHILIPLGVFSVFFICAFFSKKLRRVKEIFIVFTIFIIFLTLFDFYRNAYRFLTFSNSKFLYPDIGVTKFLDEAAEGSLARTQGLTEPEISSYLRIPSVETYDPMYSLRTARLLNALQGTDDTSLQINKYRVIPGRPETKRIYDFMGVSNIVVSKGVNPSLVLYASVDRQTDFDSVYTDDVYMVYKNKTAFPRFGLYDTYWISSSDVETLYLVSQNASVGRDDIVLEESLPIVITKGESTASLREYKENTITFDIETKTEKLFYLSDTYDPGWKAQIDGRDTRIYRANYNFRTVLVPAGKSILRFEYVPKNFALGMYISIASIVCIVFIGGLGILQRKSN